MDLKHLLGDVETNRRYLHDRLLSASTHCGQLATDSARKRGPSIPPSMVRLSRPQPHAGAVRGTASGRSAALRLALQNLQPLASPDALRTLPVHRLVRVQQRALPLQLLHPLHVDLVSGRQTPSASDDRLAASLGLPAPHPPPTSTGRPVPPPGAASLLSPLECASASAPFQSPFRCRRTKLPVDLLYRGNSQSQCPLRARPQSLYRRNQCRNAQREFRS